MPWQAWLQQSWFASRLGRRRRPRRDDGLVRGWRIRRLEERRVLSVTAVDAGGDIANIDEGSLVTLAGVTFADDAGAGNSPHTATIDWGDGNVTAGTVTEPTGSTDGEVDGSHRYADEGVYTVTITVEGDDNTTDSDTLRISVVNVAPTLTVVNDQTANEGSQVSITDIGTFTDPGFNNAGNPIPGGETAETFTFNIDWGDGTADSNGAATIDTPGAPGTLTAGSFNGSHTYADNGVYTVTVTVSDDDGGSDVETFTVTVNNVAPNLSVVTDQTANEGAQVSITNIGAFTDPGFNNASNPIPGGETIETFTFNIDWGDGTADSNGTATIDTLGSAGTPTAGSFDGSHTYADNGVYTVTVTVTDDDNGSDVATFTITINNVAPNLSVVADQASNEGSLVSITNIGAFTDPGFNNAANPIPGGETAETFTFNIDWGDGTADSNGTATIDTLGSIGTPTAGSFDGSHTYADNGVYTVTVTVTDDDNGSDVATFTVTVANVAPTLTVIADQTVTEDATTTFTDIGTFTDPGFNNPLNPLPGGETAETFTFTINWGDGPPTSNGSATVDTPGSPGVLTAGSFNGTHKFKMAGVYTVTVTVFDDDGGSDTKTFQVTVGAVAPLLTVANDQSADEGAQAAPSPIGTFTNSENNATHTVLIDWGDGTSSAGTVTENNGNGSITASHRYADDGVYLVTVTLSDDDGDTDVGSFQVTVSNVAPTLVVPNNQSANEGATVNITNVGAFTDPGFNNPLNPIPGGETSETFTFSIDWGDGSAVENGVPTIDTAGSSGVPTAGSFDGAHVYADNGVYTVIVTVFDDDGGSHQQTFTITVNNVAPQIVPSGDQTVDEGASLSLIDIATFTDPGFDNPANPIPGGETSETFTYSIDWGDGTTDSAGVPTTDQLGSAGIPTAGSLDGGHVYADNGVYTVTVTVTDDDNGVGQATFTVTVLNVAPTIGVAPNQAVNEGSTLNIVDVASLSDPGFNNPLNPIPGGETEETFTFTIDWGDGTTDSVGSATIDQFGAMGVMTLASFDGSHVYADDGVYTVTVTVSDDDNGVAVQSFTVTVFNVGPLIDGNQQSGNEGTTISLTFTDPGFDNPANPIPGGETTETFTYSIDWGDGTIEGGISPILVAGGPGVLTVGGLSHVYADNGLYFVAITVFDDDGGFDNKVVLVNVFNVAPVLDGGGDQSTPEGGLINLVGATFTDAGTLDTHTVMIDWGDGSFNGGVVVETPFGPPGSLSGMSGSVFGSHFYADNGMYTVTVVVTDDDGGVSVSTFVVTVSNVAPTIVPIAAGPTNEGQLADLPLLALLNDPGFDNPFNPNVPGGSREFFTFTINWGDGSPTTPTTLAALVSAGGPGGVLTVGRAFGSHAWADNGTFNVTITVFDDDGGSAQTVIQVTVLNVAPQITDLFAEDIGSDSVGLLTGAFTDPGADSFTVTIDWGDTQPNTVIDIPVGGLTAFFESHQYFAPPDPNNPAAPIPVSVTIEDDDEGVATQLIMFNVPGTGLVGALSLPAPAAAQPIAFIQGARIEQAPTSRSTDVAVIQGADANAAGGESAAQEDLRQLVLRIISPSGDLVLDPRTGRPKELILTESQLRDLRRFFRFWPDGHYRIDLREGKSERLIIEVYVRQGELVDPADIEELEASPDGAVEPPGDAPGTEAAPDSSPTAGDAVWDDWQPRRAIGSPTSTPPRGDTDEQLPLESDSDWEQARTLGAGVVAAGLTNDAWHRWTRRVDTALANGEIPCRRAVLSRRRKTKIRPG